MGHPVVFHYFSLNLQSYQFSLIQVGGVQRAGDAERADEPLLPLTAAAPQRRLRAALRPAVPSAGLDHCPLHLGDNHAAVARGAAQRGSRLGCDQVSLHYRVTPDMMQYVKRSTLTSVSKDSL